MGFPTTYKAIFRQPTGALNLMNAICKAEVTVEVYRAKGHWRAREETTRREIKQSTQAHTPETQMNQVEHLFVTKLTDWRKIYATTHIPSAETAGNAACGSKVSDPEQLDKIAPTCKICETLKHRQANPKLFEVPKSA